LEQHTRKQSLEIHGIPESVYSSTEEAVIKVAEALDVEIGPEVIDISHKLHSEGEKPIIVKFTSHKVKSKLYKRRTGLKNIKTFSRQRQLLQHEWKERKYLLTRTEHRIGKD